MFITLEGPEGCGKSTHAQRLHRFLEERGHQVVLTQEPGGTQLGKQVRRLLLDPVNVLDETTEVYLFAADRSEHVSKLILPALRQGKIVISDRYVDSTVAYQIGGRGLPEDMVRYINMVSSRGLLPELTILLDVEPEVGLPRAARKGAADRFEKEQLDFHRRVRAKYLAIAGQDPGRFRVIRSGERSLDDIQQEVRRIVEEKLK